MGGAIACPASINSERNGPIVHGPEQKAVAVDRLGDILGAAPRMVGRVLCLESGDRVRQKRRVVGGGGISLYFLLLLGDFLSKRVYLHSAICVAAFGAAVILVAPPATAQWPGTDKQAIPIETAAATTQLVLDVASRSALAKREWSALTGKNKAGKKKSAGDASAAPLGYTKGMALLYAEDYARLQHGDQVILALSRGAAKDNDNDGLAQFRAKFANIGLDVTSSGAEALRSLYVLLFELGVRETDGRYYLGLDSGPNKPDEEINANTTEAGLFSSSCNFSSDDTLAHSIFQRYRTAGSVAGKQYLRIFAEGVPPPENGNDANVGTGDGLVFQKLTKANPRFATEFAAAAVRHSGYLNYFFIQFNLMEISKEAAQLFTTIENIVDIYGPPRL
jgi:hypothetical protein